MAEPFGVASLDLLADRALTVRSDWKFVLRQSLVPELLRTLSKTHLVLMAGQERWGRYSSQYYDTPDQVCFHDHRRGKPRRFKVRHRDYLDRNLTMLEIKDRVPRGDTHKRRLPQMWRQRVVDVAGAAFLSEGGHVPVDGLVPTLANRFYRLTLLGENVLERLTVDLCIGFGLDGRIGGLPGVCVLEVKSAPLQDPYFGAACPGWNAPKGHEQVLCGHLSSYAWGLAGLVRPTASYSGQAECCLFLQSHLGTLNYVEFGHIY